MNTETSNPSSESTSLVVELRLAAGGGEALQRGGEVFERLQRRIGGEIGERQSDMIGVVERMLGDGVGFETVDDLFVGHGSSTAVPWSACRIAPGRQRRAAVPTS